MLNEEIKSAVHDLRYLLNRGYPRDSAVEFVSDHYLLELERRHLLTRCVFSKEEIRDHRSRLLNRNEVDGKEVGVDGYNVLITVESILNGEKVIRCDDGFIRDLQAIFGKYEMSDSTEPALTEILRIMKDLDPEKVVMFFDEQVSRSGELAGLTRRKLEDIGLEGDAKTAKGTDAKVWKYEISASSDRVVIERSEKMLDIPAEVLDVKRTRLIDISRV